MRWERVTAPVVVATLLVGGRGYAQQPVNKDRVAPPHPAAMGEATKQDAPDSAKKPAADTVKKSLADSIKKATLDSAAKAFAAAQAAKATLDSSRSCVPRRPVSPRRMLYCPPLVEVFADGNVKDVLGGKSSTAASGALGLHFVGNAYDVTGIVNVAGAGDTVLRSFGNALLVPAAGKALKAASLDIRHRMRKWGDPACVQPEYPMLCNVGWHLHADASSRLWAKDTATKAVNGDSTLVALGTIEVPVWGVGFDLTYSFFKSAITGSDSVHRAAEMLIDLGVTRRALRGDLMQDRTDRAEIRQRLLGDSAHTHFDGIEVGLSMIYDKIRASFTYVRLNGKVDGLSKGQIVAAVDLRAALASGVLR